MKNGLCFNCGIPGHIAKDCKKPKKFGQSGMIYDNCGNACHITRKCYTPKCGNYGAPAKGQA